MDVFAIAAVCSTASAAQPEILPLEMLRRDDISNAAAITLLRHRHKMPTADVGEIFAASVSGMATILLISAVGVYLALRPKLPRPVLHADALRQLSRLIVTMCWPAMATYGVGKALDGEKLASLWPLLVMPLVNLLVGYLVTMAMCQVMQTSARLTPALVVSGMFANSAALPLVLLSALCRQPILSDVEDCDDRSLAYIMVYTIPWSVCFFVVAMPWLKKVAAPPPEGEDRRPPFALLGLECNAAAWKAALCTGPMGGTAFGVLCALWPWLQDNLFRQASVLRPGATHTMAEPKRSLGCLHDMAITPGRRWLTRPP
jgi:hypothetical protein